MLSTEQQIKKFGAAGSLYDILTDERLNHRVEVETGVLQEECAQIMQDFFRNRRQKVKNMIYYSWSNSFA